MVTLFKYLIFLGLSVASVSAENKQIRVGIIDTGLDVNDPRFSSLLCKDIRWVDLTGTGIKDTNGHGTHIAGLIKQYAGNADYCLVIIKFYDDMEKEEEINAKRMIEGEKWAAINDLDIVNISAGGKDDILEEQATLYRAKLTTFIVAAGNGDQNLDDKCDYYPACYQLGNIVVVGNLSMDGEKNKSSNYGKWVDAWEIGENILSTLPDHNTDFPTYERKGYMTGTSQATAIHTGKTIYNRWIKKYE